MGSNAALRRKGVGWYLNLSIDIGSPSHWNPLVSVSIRHLNWPIALGHLLWGTYQASHALSCTCQFIQKALKKTAWNIIKESSNECIERLVPPIDTVRRSLCEASLTLPFGLIFLLLHSIPKILKSGIMLGLWLWHVQVASMELWKFLELLLCSVQEVFLQGSVQKAGWKRENGLIVRQGRSITQTVRYLYNWVSCVAKENDEIAYFSQAWIRTSIR